MSSATNNGSAPGQKKILVFGGTGPAGICLLRELLHRQHPTIAFVRNPSKIPDDLKSNPLLEIIKAELTDTATLAPLLARTSSIISLLGPNSLLLTQPQPFTAFYQSLFPLMKQHHVRRIFAMGTLSIPQPQDNFSILRFLIVAFIRLCIPGIYRTIRGIEAVFEAERGGEVDWTVYRIAGIPGGHDETSWKRDRLKGEVFEGYVAEKGWTITTPRGLLARWLVDAVEDGKKEWIGKMPAIGRMAGSKAKTE